MFATVLAAPASRITTRPAPDPWAELLTRAAPELAFDRDAEIFAQDDPARYCYQVTRGCVRTVRVLEDGRRQLGDFLFAGDLLGVESLGTHLFGAEAVTPVALRRLPLALVEAQAARDPAFARQRWAHGLARLRAAQERQVLLGRRTAAERIASFLLEMSARLQSASRLDLPMSRGDIADYLCLTIETVCRGLTQLQRQGVVTLERGGIFIRDRRALGGGGARLH